MGANSAIQICSGEARDGIRRAVSIAGGQSALARKIGVAQGHVWDWLNKSSIPADHCPAVEQATAVTCDDLRPDLVWVRDAANEILGYVTPVDGADAAYVRQAINAPATPMTRVDGKCDVLSYRAGLMHGVDREYCDELLNTTYRGLADWTDPEALSDLLADVEDWRSVESFFTCFGMLYDLDEKTRERLLTECGVNKTRDWSQQKSNELWAKAQAIRLENPHMSDIAGTSFAAGIASVTAVQGDEADFRDFHGIGKKSTWDADHLSGMAGHALTVILDAVLSPDRPKPAAWSNLITGSTFQMRSMVGSETAERIATTAGNLLDLMIPGIEAIHDYQFSVLTGNREDTLDSGSPTNLCALLMILQELVGVLVNLRDNMLFRQRELEG